MYVRICIYVCIHMFENTYIYIQREREGEIDRCIERDREREKERERERDRATDRHDMQTAVSDPRGKTIDTKQSTPQQSTQTSVQT